MRGRTPPPLTIAPADTATLRSIARSDPLPWYQVRRPRIVLGVAAGGPVHVLASPMQCDEASIWRTCRRYERSGLPGLLAPPQRPGRSARISPLPQAQIVEPAGLGPVAKGLPITPWSRDDLAHQAVAEGLVSSLSAATIRRLSNRVDWQPHRTRYWKTSRRDAQSKRRAAKILWCSADADRLAQRGDGIVGLAEMPTRQALGRDPLRRPSPGSIEQPGFESTRHGTVTIPVFWIVPTGRMEAVCVEKKDALHDIEQRERSRDRHRDLEGVYLIQDGDPSHTATPPRSYFAKARGGWRPRFTPVHASWLNPTGLLHPGFGLRPLRRGSWRRREEYIAHGDASWPEYNERYAEPFEGTWTNHKMRKWFFEHAR